MSAFIWSSSIAFGELQLPALPLHGPFQTALVLGLGEPVRHRQGEFANACGGTTMAFNQTITEMQTLATSMLARLMAWSSCVALS